MRERRREASMSIFGGFETDLPQVINQRLKHILISVKLIEHFLCL
jgi:hypothetical protein